MITAEAKLKYSERARARYAANPSAQKARSAKRRAEKPALVRSETKAAKAKKPEHYKKVNAAWRAINRERLKAEDAARYRHNKDTQRAKIAAWKAANPEKVAAINAARRAARKSAVPSWANRFFIEEIYHLARLRTKLLGVKHHVDHIVPLRSEIVCGLHCERNLRVIPAIDNQKKHNKYWPDMPGEAVKNG